MTHITIGTHADDAASPLRLDARRFNRHTFWCGQSGSGKTYALGVVLEQLLLHTELPMVIIDPNGDYVRMRETRPSVDPDVRERIRASDVRVFRAGAAAPNGARVRFADMTAASKAAVLQLDPIGDADEYNALLSFEASAGAIEADTILDRLRSGSNPGWARLAQRIENLQILDWDVWSRGGPCVVDAIDERPRASVLDIGGFAHPAEPLVASLAVLERLWVRRAERRPVLIVIDEAHNLCPPDVRSAVQAAITELLVQIAAEGRKFGLWLFLSTQRPTKIHPNVLAQCDNLGLMRVNSPRDLDELTQVFGFAPEELVRRSSSFRQGQALFAGSFIGEATVGQMGERLTQEAGSDVAVPLG